ncbi:MAG: hypothetical protein ACYC5O_01630 [Anaerolineae bacterium]
MTDTRERILQYLAEHPEGATDAEIAEALELEKIEEADAACSVLADQGLVKRRVVGRAFVNLLSGSCPPLME